MGPRLPPLPSIPIAAVEAGVCTVGSGGVAGGEAGGRQGAGGGLEGQMASAAPLAPLRRRQHVWSAVGSSFVSGGLAGGSGSTHGRRRHDGRWNTAAAVMHVFGGGGATHGRCWLVDHFVETIAVALVPWQPPPTPTLLSRSSPVTPSCADEEAGGCGKAA
jgi:hypothetical protein